MQRPWDKRGLFEEVQGKAGRPMHLLEEMGEGESDSIQGVGGDGLCGACRLM